MSSTREKNATAAPTRRAGAFDIRAFIASLIGIYGLVLLVAGIIGPSDAELEKAGGMNINLYAGVGMIVVSAGFLLWARLRPVVVAQGPDSAGEEDGRPAGQ